MIIVSLTYKKSRIIVNYSPFDFKVKVIIIKNLEGLSFEIINLTNGYSY